MVKDETTGAVETREAYEKVIGDLRSRIETLERARDFKENVMYAITSGMMVLDNELNIILLNEEGKRIFGVTGAEYYGSSYFNGRKPFMERIKADVDDAVAGDKSLERDKLLVDENLIISYSIFIIRDSEGKNMGVLIMGSDITENEKIKSQLYQSDKLATIGTMISGVAHELRNPLTIINARAQRLLAKKSEMNKQIRHGIQSVLEQSERCGKIVDDLLNFTRKEAHGFSFQDLNKVLDEAMRLFRMDEKASKIEVRSDFCRESTAFVDKSQMVQMFLNLFTNAADAMEGHGLLELITRNDDRFVKVLVKDNGPGIPEKHVHKIFDPFFTTKEVGQGTGLGLSIVYRIIEVHKGRIHVDSIPGCTIIEIDIPVAKP
jgi:PAS domain S-box-containing protein